MDEEEEILYQEIGNESEVEEDFDTAEGLWEDEDLEEYLLELGDPKDGDPSIYKPLVPFYECILQGPYRQGSSLGHPPAEITLRSHRACNDIY